MEGVVYISSRLLQVYQLYIVLVKKKDPISHTSFLQNISQVKCYVALLLRKKAHNLSSSSC